MIWRVKFLEGNIVVIIPNASRHCETLRSLLQIVHTLQWFLRDAVVQDRDSTDYAPKYRKARVSRHSRTSLHHKHRSID